jgi:hypothetical protein
MRKILLQNNNKEILFAETYRILVDNGKLLVVGWSDDAIKGFGTEDKLSKESVKEFAAKVGFVDFKELEAGQYHYAFIFTK